MVVERSPDTGGKRTLADTSIEEAPSPGTAVEPKKALVVVEDQSGPSQVTELSVTNNIPPVTTNTSGSLPPVPPKPSNLTSPITSPLPSSPMRFNSVLTQLKTAMREEISTLSEDMNRRFDQSDEKQATITAELQAARNEISSLKNRIVDLEKENTLLSARVATLEVVGTGHSGVAMDWKPNIPDQTSILLYADSNLHRLVKFGTGKGTFGEALPGSDIWCARVGDFPDVSDGHLGPVSDIVFSVGTNDLKVNVEPEELASVTFSKVKQIIEGCPGVNIHIVGIPPLVIDDDNKNFNIKRYNDLIRNMCQYSPQTVFVDVGALAGPNGLLKPNLARDPGDPYHYNDHGVKIVASRIKNSIRSKHGLPITRNLNNRRNRSSNNSNQHSHPSNNHSNQYPTPNMTGNPSLDGPGRGGGSNGGRGGGQRGGGGGQRGGGGGQRGGHGSGSGGRGQQGGGNGRGGRGGQV